MNCFGNRSMINSRNNVVAFYKDDIPVSKVGISPVCVIGDLVDLINKCRLIRMALFRDQF